MLVSLVSLLSMTPTMVADPVAQVRAVVKPVIVEGAPEQGGMRISMRHLEIVPQGGGQSGNAQPQLAPPPRVMVTEEIILTPLDARPPSEDRFSPPSLPNYFMTSAYLGQGDGYRWYVRASFEQILKLSKGLPLSGGEDMVGVAVRSLDSRDWRGQALRHEYLKSAGDEAIAPLAKAAPTHPEAIQFLADLRTPSAIDALLVLHGDERLRRAVQESLGWGTPIESARPIYEASLREGTYVASTASAAAKFGWKEWEPQIERSLSAATHASSATSLLNSLTVMRTGRPLPAYDKVQAGFSDWTAADTAAILASRDPVYPILVAFRMASMVNKSGRPFIVSATSILTAQREAGQQARIDRWAKQLQMPQDLITP